MKPKLYQYEACPFCNKVKSLLEYKGVDYEVVEVHPLKKTELEFSEYKKVPVYIDSEGKQVNDSNAIMKRIEEEFPVPSVYSQDSLQAAQDETWMNWSESYVKGLPTAIYDTFSNSLKSFNYITKVGQFSWFEKVKVKYLGAFVMSMVSKKIKKREGIEDPAEFLRTKASEWSKGLGARSFMGGEEPSVSDIAVHGITRCVEGLNAGNILLENKEFASWYSRMNQKLNRKEVLV